LNFKDKGKKFTKLLKDKVSKERYKVYKTDLLYFLVSENDDYLGCIEIKNKHIKSSDSKLKRGFYLIMFTVILTDINEIFSDFRLSTQAINSYEKLAKNNQLSIKLYNTVSKEYFNFSKEKLKEDNIIVSIKEKHNGSINEMFKEFYERLSYNSSMRVAYENKSSVIDNYQFCENIKEV
jgi:hypothetical protein